MVEVLVAIAVVLIVPAFAVLLVEAAYRLARGRQLPIPRVAHQALALIGIASALIGVFSALTAFTDQSTSGPNIPTGLAVLNVLLVLGIMFVGRPSTRSTAG